MSYTPPGAAAGVTSSAVTDALGYTPTSVTGLTGALAVSAFKTGLSLGKADVGLSSVDNTADSAKAVLSATKLTTARTINGTSFDGSANITINAVDSTARLASSAVSAFGLTLIDDADAAAARATLGAQAAGSYASGTGSANGTNTGDETKATIDAKIGVDGSTATFYRKDGTWAAPSGGSAPSDFAFAATWDADAANAPSKNAVYDAIKAQLASYRTLIEPTGSHTAARAAGTYGFAHGQPLAITGVGTLYALDVIYIDSADYPAIGGLTAKLRLRATLAVNDVAPTGNYVVGLHPVTRPATSGGAGLGIYTIGAAVAGSTLTFTAPAADSHNNGVGSDFALPANGFYIVGMVSSAAVAASSHLHLSAILQMRYT